MKKICSSKRHLKKLLLQLPVIIVLSMSLLSSAFAADLPDAGGSVERADMRLWARRDSSRVDLDVGSGVHEHDVLYTNETGAGSIRFLDDSLLELGGNTEVDVKEVVFSTDRRRFNVGIVQGAARIISGSLVKQNPKQFNITTPKCAIGIRGTTVRTIVAPEGDTVRVEAMEEGDFVVVRNKGTHELYSITGVGGEVNIRADNSATFSGAVLKGLPNIGGAVPSSIQNRGNNDRKRERVCPINTPSRRS